MTLKETLDVIPFDYFEIVSHKKWEYNHKNSMVVSDQVNFGFRKARVGMSDDWGIYKCPVAKIETTMAVTTWGGEKRPIIKITLDD